ncbi:hypothetical protein [Wenyingzhuangia sp. IMCC45467]
MKKLLLFILFTLLLTTKSNAQRRFIYQHEFGGEIGISNFQTDFTAKGPADGKLTINGFALNGTHYLHILPRRYGANPIYRHAILKTSLGINTSSFDNKSYGTGNKPLSSPPENTPNNILLARLSSKTTILSLDNELQFYLRDIIRFLHRYNRYRNKNKVNPYLAVGLGINYFSSTPTYGKDGENLSEKNIYPDKYKASYISKTNSVSLSTNFAFGARYKASPYYDLVAQMGFKYYLSDWIDGVNPDLDSNISNDFNTVISVGFVYHMF